MTRPTQWCDRCLTKKKLDPAFPDCDARHGQPCRNCRQATSASTGKQPCCKMRGVPYTSAAAATSQVKQNLTAGRPTHPSCDRCLTLRGLNPSFPECDAHLGAPCRNCRRDGKGAPSCLIRNSTKSAEEQAAIAAKQSATAEERALRMHRLPPQSPSETVQPVKPHTMPGNCGPPQQVFMHSSPPSAPRYPSTAPRALVDHLRRRAEDAERERAKMRADSRSVQELQDKIHDLKARLELETRARNAAEERTNLAYEQGYRYGLQSMQAQTMLAMPSVAEASGFGQYLLSAGVSSQPAASQSMQVVHGLPMAADDAQRDQYNGEPTEDNAQRSTYEGERAAPALPSSNEPADSCTAIQSQPRSLINRSADPRLQALKERALASTARFRDKQAADQWLENNAHILEGGESDAAAGEERVGEKRKRAAPLFAEYVDMIDGGSMDPNRPVMKTE